MNHLPYLVRPNEPCIFTEIYLPKKAELQGILYETLTEGFKRQTVIDHFLKANKVKKQRILEMLSKGWTVFPSAYPSQKDIRAFPRLFFGYSTYEVNGVFLKEREDKQYLDDSDDNYEIIEELTQVIRLIFKYRCFDRPFTEIDFCKASLRDPFSEIGTFKDNYPYLRDRLTPEIERALTELDEWIKYVGLFVFGYVLFVICDKIVRLSKENAVQRKPSSIKQDEIWVSSLWNMNVNVVEWIRT